MSARPGELKKKQAEARFQATIIEDPAHEIELIWEGRDTYKTGGTHRRNFSIACSCGQGEAREWRWYASTNKDGSIPTRQTSTANGHIITQQSLANLPILSEPILVAKVHKQRVVHEWWIAPYDSDLVYDVIQIFGWDQPEYGSKLWPWVVMKKQSNGWKLHGTQQSIESAVHVVQSFVEKEKWRGNGVEILYSGTEVGVEAPAGTVLNSIKALINEGKSIDDKTSPHEIAAILQATDEAVHQMNLLTEFREELRSLYAQAIDLT